MKTKSALILLIALAFIKPALAASPEGVSYQLSPREEEETGTVPFPSERMDGQRVGNVGIAIEGSQVVLSWEPVPGALSYNVYSATSETDVGLDLSGTFAGSSWTAPLNGDRRFYFVTHISPDSPILVFVQGGTIIPTTGSYSSGLSVSSFYLGQKEVSNADWNAVMGTGNADSYPHAYVNWLETIEYCNRRSLQEQLTPCYTLQGFGTDPANWPADWEYDANNHLNLSWNQTANGYRLPTDAEWEYAARGGLFTHNYQYSGYFSLDSVGWYNSNSGGYAHPGGEKTANELGTQDQSGNLFEWCWTLQSWGQPYIRGGYYNSSYMGCTVYFRDYRYVTHSGPYLGFRVCRSSL